MRQPTVERAARLLHLKLKLGPIFRVLTKFSIVSSAYLQFKKMSESDNVQPEATDERKTAESPSGVDVEDVDEAITLN